MTTPSKDLEALAMMARATPDRLTLAQFKELAGAVIIREAMRHGRMQVAMFKTPPAFSFSDTAAALRANLGEEA